MANITDSKRLSDEELEAVAGGVTPPTIDPLALAGLMHSTVSAAVSGGGAYTMETPAPAHTDSGTVTGNTHVTIAGESLFADLKPIAAAPVQPAAEAPHLVTIPANVVHGTVTIMNGSPGETLGSLSINVPPPPAQTTVTVMHFDSQQGQFTPVTPIVQGQNMGIVPNLAGGLGATPKEQGPDPKLGGALGNSFGSFKPDLG